MSDDGAISQGACYEPPQSPRRAGLGERSGECTNSNTRSPSESLYIPKPQLIEDRRFLHDFMEEFAFVDLITVFPSLRITHIPVWLERTAGAYGTIHGHISRQNPQSSAFDGKQTGVIVFRGPHGYISPTWYAKTENVVPTWNFAVVHATGKLRPVEDRNELNELLSKLITKFESTRARATTSPGSMRATRRASWRAL